MISLDFAKVKTKDGRKVEIISTVGRGTFPVVGYIGDNNSYCYWTLDGKSSFEDPRFDLVGYETSVQECWINVYLMKTGETRYAAKYKTKEEAEENRNFNKEILSAKTIPLHDLFKEF